MATQPAIRRVSRCDDSRGLHPVVDLTGEELDWFRDRIGEAVLVAPAPPSLAPWTHIAWFKAVTTKGDPKKGVARTYVIEAKKGWKP